MGVAEFVETRISPWVAPRATAARPNQKASLPDTYQTIDLALSAIASAY